MRGKGLLEVFVPEPLRITPAYAGKRSASLMETVRLGDHPRVCGEKDAAFCPVQRHRGSPPRMRGKAVQIGIRLVQPGITPAYAGKSCASAHGWFPDRDHPRVCGEKGSSTSPMKCLKGSPPRVRGKATFRVGQPARLGITPACAGKSSQRTTSRPAFRDHPRVCGEKAILSQAAQVAVGSPPRVRGKGVHRNHHEISAGITPACAGKRDMDQSHANLQQDHPRVCGEKSRPGVVANSIKGSPPRMRGKETVMTPARQ